MAELAILDLGKRRNVNPGNGGTLKNEAYLIPLDFLETQPKRDATKPYLITEDLVFKSGKRPIKIYATKETLEPSGKKAKGANKDCGGYEYSIKLSNPGQGEDTLAFIHEYDGVECYIILKNIDSAEKKEVMYLYGTEAWPMMLEEFDLPIGAKITDSTAFIPTFSTVQEMIHATYEGTLPEDVVTP